MLRLLALTGAKQTLKIRWLQIVDHAKPQSVVMGPSDRPAGSPAEFHGGSSETPMLIEKWHSSRLEFGEIEKYGWNQRIVGCDSEEKRLEIGWNSEEKRLKIVCIHMVFGCKLGRKRLEVGCSWV